jgi:hypothetical protein
MNSPTENVKISEELETFPWTNLIVASSFGPSTSIQKRGEMARSSSQQESNSSYQTPPIFSGQLSNLSWQKVQQTAKHHRIDFKKLLSYIHVNLIFNILLPSIV